jgi:hypothetical protein
VAAVVDAGIPQRGRLEKVLPVVPITSRVDWAAVRLAEHQVVLFPCAASLEPLGELSCAVSLEDGHQFGWERDNPLASALRCSEG